DYTRFKWFIVTLVAINTFIVCLIISVDRFNFPLQPLLAVVVVQELLTIAQFKGLQRFGKCALVALAMLGGTFIALNARQRYPQTTAAMCERLRQIVNPRNVIAADVSYKTALLNNVLSIRLPHYPEELIEISDKYIPIDYVIL